MTVSTIMKGSLIRYLSPFLRLNRRIYPEKNPAETLKIPKRLRTMVVPKKPRGLLFPCNIPKRKNSEIRQIETTPITIFTLNFIFGRKNTADKLMNHSAAKLQKGVILDPD